MKHLHETADQIKRIKQTFYCQGRFTKKGAPTFRIIDKAAERVIHKIYNGWWYLGRPTVEELRMDLRALMAVPALVCNIHPGR